MTSSSIPVVILIGFSLFLAQCSSDVPAFRFTSTVAGTNGEFGEPFGIAARGDDLFVSDGANGTIVTLIKGGQGVWSGLDTPAGICIDDKGILVVADSGMNAIFKMDSGPILIAGAPGNRGFQDSDAKSSLFNGPIGLACADDKIFVADTYNDRIRVIENGRVSTLAGGPTGLADGFGGDARFHTPTGLAIWRDKLLVADTGNRRIRVVEGDGRVWTLAGNGDLALKDGLLSPSSFVQPTALAVDKNGIIYVADGNAIRRIGGDVIPTVTMISDDDRGLIDGLLSRARFNRPSGMAINDEGDLLIADSDNRLVRKISTRHDGHEMTAAEAEVLRDKPEEFRAAQPPRWPFDPPERPRDIAGTAGELRGEISEEDDAHFHNGLDIAGGYGETARFIRDEKVLHPIAAANFGTLRELLRMPSTGYIHLRLGRDVSSTPFGDTRFLFLTDPLGKVAGVRVPRGTQFHAGEPIGTLNAMNHVHLIAGRTGNEMNALDALNLPGLADSRSPVIEGVRLVDLNGFDLPQDSFGRIELTARTRIVMRAFDQMDASAARRRLGIYRAGYQLLRPGQTPLGDIQWTLSFARIPSNDAVRLVYGDGSHSGADGETIFNYLVTNRVDGETFSESFLDPATLDGGRYILRVFAADHAGNQTYADMQIEVKKL